MPGIEGVILLLQLKASTRHVTPPAGYRYFTGTAQSTFSFRIREDRQFMGMGADSTFNQLCGDDPTKCPDGPATWLLPPSFIKDEL